MASAILNPFIVGGALSDPSGRGFFGREEVFDFVNSSLMVVSVFRLFFKVSGGLANPPS